MTVLKLRPSLCNWIGVTMTEDQIRRAERLAYLVRQTLSERKSLWVHHVCHIYRDQRLPLAVARSLESLDRRAKSKGQTRL